MDFVNEQDIFFFQAGDNSSDISGTLHCGSRGGSNVNPHLGGNDVSQRGLAQARRAIEQNMIQGLVPPLGGGDSNS